MTVSRSIQASANGTIPFLFMAEEYSIVHMYHIFFIHSPIDGHLGCFHALAVVSSAAMNIGGACIFFELQFSLGISPRNQGLIYFYSALKCLHSICI